jgi:hypothetical protein
MKGAKRKKGIVSEPLIDFIQTENYIFPQLHFEIGAVNNVLDRPRAFIEEQVEVISDEERTLWNSKIIADMAYTKAKRKQDMFNRADLNFYKLERAHLNSELRSRTISQETRNEMNEQKEEMEYWIATLTVEQKQLKQDVSSTRDVFVAASKALKEFQSKKTKVDIPTVATMENIFLQYKISPAKYHGGKLNGVDCCEVMSQAKSLFFSIETLLFSISHPDRCSDDTLVGHCNIYQDNLVTLDLICSKLRIMRGELNINDIQLLRRARESLNYLLSKAGMSFMPKIHGVLAHAMQQAERIGGIGDLLEDDLEHLHQISKKITDQTSRIKNKMQQARSHSQMEAKLNNREIMARTIQSKDESKHLFKKQRVDATARAAQAKVERDTS